MSTSKSFILATLLILLSTISASAAKTLFDNLNDVPGISRVYISSALLKSGLANIPIPTGNSNTGSAKNFAKSLNYIEVYTSEEPAGVQRVKQELKTFLTANPEVELIITSSDEGEKNEIYARLIPGGTNFDLMIICNEEHGEIQLVVIDGEIDTSIFMSASDFTREIEFLTNNSLTLRC